MAWRALLHEHRRLLVTSYRHCASGRLTAEERTGQAPFRVLMAETIAALVRRRRQNAATCVGDGHLRATVHDVYAQVRARFESVACMTYQRARNWEERLQILHPGWQPKPGEGPWMSGARRGWRRGL